MQGFEGSAHKVVTSTPLVFVLLRLGCTVVDEFCGRGEGLVIARPDELWFLSVFFDLLCALINQFREALGESVGVYEIGLEV